MLRDGVLKTLKHTYERLLIPWPFGSDQEPILLRNLDRAIDGFLVARYEVFTSTLADVITNMSLQRDDYEKALKAIKGFGQVCEEYETCSHPACQASYAAWATADKALKKWEKGGDTL